MNERLLEALEEISDKHIAEAARDKRRRSRIWVRAAAAVLAAVLLLTLSRPAPTAVSAEELVSPADYTPPKEPSREWQTSLSEAADEAITHSREFWTAAFREFLSGGENAVWSPVNSYLSLAVLAQTASGSTRQEILDVLGLDSIEALQENVQTVWERVMLQNKWTTRTLANSLWLDASLEYSAENLEVLGQRYYTSVYRTDLKNAEADINNWINLKTDGFLNAQAAAPSARNRVLALASTVFVDDTWTENFSPEQNRAGKFHAPGGDVDCTFMSAALDTTDYLRGEDYTAVILPTNGGCSFWAILPDEGVTVSDLLDSGACLDAVLDGEPESAKVTLTMPKFDIQSILELSDGLKNLGVTKAFSILGGDFSDTLSLGGAPISLGQVRQSARIVVNEAGIRAGSGEFVDMIASSIDEPVRVTLNRPFLFVLTLGKLPLFAGVVARP